MKINSIMIGMMAIALTALLWTPAARADAPPDTLTLNDLVNHAERLPDYVIMNKTIRYGGGLSLRNGQRVRTVSFDGETLKVTAGRTNFPVGPDECNLLQAANADWAKLTPAQRAVDAATLIKDASLWPAQVKISEMIAIKGRRLPAGSTVTLAEFNKDGAIIWDPVTQGGMTGVLLSQCDLLARARELAKIDPDQRPSRIAEELKGKLVNADGTPANVDLANVKYFAIYYGANWCPWCHKLSPHLVKVMKEIGPRNPHLLFVMINDDDQPSEMLKYMTEAQMPWPALPKADAVKVGVLRSMMQTEPQLRILDYYGNELYNCPGGGPEQISADVNELMKFDQSGKGK